MNITIGTVICGTHRPQDLIPAFVAELSVINKTEFSRFVDRLPDDYGLVDGLDALDGPGRLDDEHAFWSSDDAQHMVGELTDLLSCEAGPCYYFGVHSGDGADFGFWPINGTTEQE